VEAGHFNTMFVNVLAHGHAYYDSLLLDKHPSLDEGYDPLGYAIELAHERDIAVHTWLVAGPMSFAGEPGRVLVEHPEWAMVGPDGQQINWLNYTRPDVRQFISDLVLELMAEYDVDGIHFDYTRYPGSRWGFDPYSASRFKQEYGIDLELLRFPELPAYAHFSGNPLIWPSTAQVLAEFDNGQPAVLLNEHGAGQAILLNWAASERETAVEGEILDRSIKHLLGQDGKVHILHSERNAAKYGSEDYETGFAWLEDLGWDPIETGEHELAALEPGSVLVLPQIYLIQGQAASDLNDFVQRGGGVVFVDGPTPSIWNRNVRNITGMNIRGRSFKRRGLLIPTEDHDILPSSERTLPIDAYLALDADWRAFRMNGINKLLQEVYADVKAVDPEVVVSVTVAYKQDTLAYRHLLDWQTWLAQGSVDLIVPRAYVAPDESLARAISDWRPTMRDTGHVVLGLSTYPVRTKDAGPKEPERMLSEIDTALAQGSWGVILFDLERTSDAVLEALSAGPFSPSSGPSN
jgi:uncharacterized lipoprotein YddW (UPF0748 family)